MVNYNKAIEAAKMLVNEAEAYSIKPTKASSARMRKYIQVLRGEVGRDAKRELTDADKGGK